MRRAMLGLFLPIVLLTVGCQKGDDTLGGLQREKRYKNVISLSPSSTEILLTQGVMNIVKGRTEADNFPAGSVKSVPVVASLKPDYEKIAGIKPDLIVYDADVYNEQDAQKIKELGADVFVIDARTVDDFITQLYRLGSLVAAETNVSSYVDKIVAARTAALGDPITPTPKVAVLLAGSGSAEHMIAGSDGFIVDVIKAAGGEPVGPESAKFERVNPEFLVSQNPDVIVLGVSLADKAAAQRQADAILTDPRLKSLQAIANGRIVGVDQDVLLRRGSRVDKLIERLHQAIATKGAAQ